MTERPECKCHAEPMGWQKDARMAAGGLWECRTRRREHNRAQYAKTRERRRETSRAYYDKNAMTVRWRQWRQRHRRRLAELEARI